MGLNFNLSRVTVGADPELFVGKRGEIVSGHFIPLGSKDQPLTTEHGSVQNDGLAVEVNVKPSSTRVAFLQNCAKVIDDLEKLVKKADPEMYLVCRPTARFTPQYIESLPNEVKELGCNPDYDAYDIRENPKPDADGNMRTAGGHIHIGWGSGFNVNSLEHVSICAEVAKQLDYCIGLPALEFDRDEERRKMYGQAGCFRPKSYGMEYRVLSPLWLLSVSHTSMVYDGVFKALRKINEECILDEQFDGLARQYINGNEYNWRFTTPELEKAIFS